MHSPFQRWIFDEITRKYAKKSEVVEALSKLLSVGKDAIYRRMRAETVLTPEELVVLAKTYQISLDDYVYEQTNGAFFTYSPFVQEVQSFDDYLKRLKDNLSYATQLPNCVFKYASPAIPVFYLCKIPELIAFKLYTWGSTSWDFPYLQNKKFDFDLVPYPILQEATSIFDLYCQIPSIELWSLNLIDFSLNQIEYYVRSDAFAEDQIAFVICDKLVELLNQMEAMAQHGQKFRIGTPPRENFNNFELYHNDMLYTDHTIIASSDIQKAVFASFGNPNFIKSGDQRIATYADSWFDRLKTKSHSISTHSEKTRKWFFNRLRKKVKALKVRIENELAYD